MLNMNTSKTLFFHSLLFEITFEIRNWLVVLENKSLNLSDQVQIVRLMWIIIMELNYLQDYKLG